MNETNPENKYFHVWITSQQSCRKGKQTIEKSLFTVIFSPSLDSLCQTHVNWFSYVIFVIVLYFISSDDFVLIVKNKKEERNNQSHSNKKKMSTWIDLLPSWSIVRSENDVIKRYKSNSKTTNKFLNYRNSSILLKNRYLHLRKQKINYLVNCCYQNYRIKK